MVANLIVSTCGVRLRQDGEGGDIDREFVQREAAPRLGGQPDERQGTLEDDAVQHRGQLQGEGVAGRAAFGAGPVPGAASQFLLAEESARVAELSESGDAELRQTPAQELRGEQLLHEQQQQGEEGEEGLVRPLLLQRLDQTLQEHVLVQQSVLVELVAQLHQVLQLLPAAGGCYGS